MTDTKYLELKAANERRKGLFEEYEEKCRTFVKRLQEGLIDYLGCPEDLVIWVQFNEGKSEENRRTQEIVEFTLDNRLVLYKDAFYQFVLRILFDSRWIDLNLKIKSEGDCIVVKLGQESLNVHKDKQDEFDELIQHVFGLAKESLETDFENFIHGKPSRSLGFRTSGG